MKCVALKQKIELFKAIGRKVKKKKLFKTLSCSCSINFLFELFTINFKS